MFRNPDRRRYAASSCGFTLVELLVTIVLLGILAAIVVYAVGSSRADSVTSICKTDMRSISLAAEAYFTHTDQFPNNKNQMVAPNPNGQLGAWPGGTSATQDELVFAYSRNNAHGYAITISGKTFSTPHTVYGDDSESAVEGACRPA